MKHNLYLYAIASFLVTTTETAPLFSPIPSKFSVLDEKLLDVFVQAADLSSVVEFIGNDKNGTAGFNITVDFNATVWVDEPDKAMVTKINGICFVVFRATTPTRLDWAQNLNPSLAEDVCSPTNCCTTRRGFRNAYLLADYTEQLESAVRECATTNTDQCTKNSDDDSLCDVVLTGSSQGGAVATVAMALLSDLRPTLVSFGQPPAMERDDTCLNYVVNPDKMYRFVNTIVGTGSDLVFDPVPFLGDYASIDQIGHMFVLSGEDNSSVVYYRDGETPNVDRYHWAYLNFQTVHSFYKYLSRLEALRGELVSSPTRNATIDLDGWRLGTTCSRNEQCEARVCNYFNNTCTTGENNCIVETATLNANENISNAVGDFFSNWNNVLAEVKQEPTRYCRPFNRRCSFDFREYSSNLKSVCADEGGQFVEESLGLECTGKLFTFVPVTFHIATDNIPACVSRDCDDAQLLSSSITSPFSRLLTAAEIGIESTLGVECKITDLPTPAQPTTIQELIGIKLINFLNRKMNDNETMVFEQSIVNFLNHQGYLATVMRIEVLSANIIDQVLAAVSSSDDDDRRNKRLRRLSPAGDNSKKYTNLVITNITAQCFEEYCNDVSNGTMGSILKENNQLFREVLIGSSETYFSRIDNITVELDTVIPTAPGTIDDDDGGVKTGVVIVIVLFVLVVIIVGAVIIRRRTASKNLSRNKEEERNQDYLGKAGNGAARIARHASFGLQQPQAKAPTKY